jgi:GAF domain-containing protein
MVDGDAARAPQLEPIREPIAAITVLPLFPMECRNAEELLNGHWTQVEERIAEEVNRQPWVAIIHRRRRLKCFKICFK